MDADTSYDEIAAGMRRAGARRTEAGAARRWIWQKDARSREPGRSPGFRVTDIKPPADVLSATQERRFVLQEFRPLAEALDWELGQLYWNERGSGAFVSGDVPFAINNDGDLSRNAAEVFFASLDAAERQGTLERKIAVLELGVGTGLFARYFLDRLKQLCAEHGRDYYDRCSYVAADRSTRMLSDISKHGILDGHAGRYQLRSADALRPEASLASGGETSVDSGARYRGIFLNYLLDSLPAAVLRIDGGQVSQLCIRTCLARGVDLTEYTRLSPEALAQRAASSDAADKRELIDLYRLFSLDFDFRPVDAAELPHASVALRVAGTEARDFLHNYGAMQSLEGFLGLLHEEGFVLINDYGFAESSEPAWAYEHQRFSGSTAIGVNFPLLKAFVEESGCSWVEPAGDNDHILSRLVGRKLAAEAVERFRERFSRDAFEWTHEPIELARICQKEARYEAAMTAYREALKRQPDNCFLLGELATFLTFTIHDYPAGLEMAKAALALNPICPDLWNTYGDCLFYLERVDEAHEAFSRAFELHPENVRACYNLIYTYCHYHDYLSALQMVACGLAHDRTGEYGGRLLERQAEILGRLRSRQQVEAGCQANRSSRITYADVAKGTRKHDGK